LHEGRKTLTWRWCSGLGLHHSEEGRCSTLKVSEFRRSWTVCRNSQRRTRISRLQMPWLISLVADRLTRELHRILEMEFQRKDHGLRVE
jgi:hypothetical protein